MTLICPYTVSKNMYIWGRPRWIPIVWKGFVAIKVCVTKISSGLQGRAGLQSVATVGQCWDCEQLLILHKFNTTVTLVLWIPSTKPVSEKEGKKEEIRKVKIGRKKRGRKISWLIAFIFAQWSHVLNCKKKNYKILWGWKQHGMMRRLFFPLNSWYKIKYHQTMFFPTKNLLLLGCGREGRRGRVILTFWLDWWNFQSKDKTAFPAGKAQPGLVFPSVPHSITGLGLSEHF